MRLEQLHYLLAISKHKSMNAAAKEIHVSQQNLSVAICNLEEEFGVKLLVRSYKGAYLTEDGERFLGKAKEVLTTVDELYTLFGKEKLFKNDLKGRLVLDVVPYMTLPDILVSFCKQHPRVDLVLTEHNPPEILRNVAQGASDLGIIIRTDEDPKLSLSMQDLGLVCDNIIDDRIFVCAGKNSALKNRRVISLPELFRQKLIVSEILYGWIVEIIKRYKNPADLQIQKYSNIQIYKKIIQEGLAVGFVTGIGLEKELIFSKGEVNPIALEGKNKITIGLVRPATDLLSETCREFVDYLKLKTKNYCC